MHCNCRSEVRSIDIKWLRLVRLRMDRACPKTTTLDGFRSPRRTPFPFHKPSAACFIVFIVLTLRVFSLKPLESVIHCSAILRHNCRSGRHAGSKPCRSICNSTGTWDMVAVAHWPLITVPASDVLRLLPSSYIFRGELPLD